MAANIAITQSQMANIVVGSSQESIRWREVDASTPILVTLFFHAFENSGLILDEGLISQNRTGYPSNATSPDNGFIVQILSKAPSTDAKVVLNIISSQFYPSITIMNFTGSSINDVGLPGTNISHAVATQAGQIEDVQVNNNWVASFAWSQVIVHNQTTPQLLVYDTTGAQIDGRYVTVTGVKLLPVRGALGFWITAQNTFQSSATWLLESSFSIITKPNTGFQTRALPRISPNAIVYADLSGIIPIVTVWWLLPIQSNTETILIGGYKYSDCAITTTLVDQSYAPQSCGLSLAQDHTTGIFSLSFHPKAVGLTIPVTIQTVAPDGNYQSTTLVTVKMDPFWDQSSAVNAYKIVGAVISILVLVFMGLLISRRRRPRRFDPMAELRGRLAEST